MKKNVVSTIILTVLLSLCVFSSALALEVKAGETFDITFTITSNPNKTVAGSVDVDYDSSVFQAIPNDAFDGSNLIFLGGLSGIAVGTPLDTISFSVKSGAAAGTYTISATSQNDDGVQVSSVSVTVVGDPSAPTPVDPEPGTEDCKHEKTTEKVTKQATCEEAGEKQFVCDKCGEVVKTEVIPALGHKWDAGKETTKATCEEKGVKTYTCQNDATHTKTETIPALGHDFKWKTVKEATAEAEGLRQSVCSRCGKVDKEEKIPKLTAQMMINNAICAQGLLLRDYRPDLTSRWYMVTPIDLSQDGVQEFRLIIGYTRYAGTVTVTVKDGKATVNYKIQYPATMRDMAFTLLPDLDSLTNAELKKGQKTYKFGQEIDIAAELNGDTSALLYVLGHGDYDYLTKDLDWFLPSSAAYRKTVEQLKGLMQ